MKIQNIIIFYHSETSGATKSILTLRDNKYEKYFHFLKIPESFFKSLNLILRNFKKLAQSHIFIINSLSVLKNLNMLLLNYFLKLFGKKVFIYWQESEWHWNGLIPEKKTIRSKVFHKIIRKVIKKDVNIAASKYNVKWLEGKFKLKKKVELLYTAINFKKVLELSKVSDSDIFKKKFIVIIAIGAATSRKGFNIFLDVADRAPQNYIFVWIGKQGNLDEEYVQKIESANIREGYEKIKILDFNPNPYPLLNNSDIFFLPSLDEPFGIVYMEALALGKFVICPAKKCGFSELVNGKQDLAFIYRKISQVINLLKSKDIDYYIKNFKKERMKLAKKFDNKYFFKKFIEILKNYP